MSYLGSKGGSGVFQTIINTFPPHDVYIEPFLGSAQIMKRKTPAKVNIGIDLDLEVIKSIKASPLPTSKDNEFIFLVDDAIAFLKGLDTRKYNNALIYCDPPYLLSTRTSNHRYNHELTEAQHIELLTTLKALPCCIVLSGYPSELYNDLLPNWRTIQFNAMTRGGVRIEKLWLNFEPGLLHCSSYAGHNFTDRQRIKRKVERWENKFNALPLHEQQVIINSLNRCFDCNVG